MSDDECEPIFALVAAVFRQAVRDAKRGYPKGALTGCKLWRRMNTSAM